MIALFVGHGNPMNAIEDNEFRYGWREAALRIPRPKGVLCISAHWETNGVYVTTSDRPETIHDFYGFPKRLYEVQYPAPGDPRLARQTAQLLTHAAVGLDPARGLDHGCWSVLCAMYPEADVPVVQLSLDSRRAASFHYSLARELAPLREQGVLIMGSGNIVHNLRLFEYGRRDALGWAVRFDEEVRRRILARQEDRLIAYETLGPDAQLAIPTPEHYLPLLYVLALRKKDDKVSFFNDRILSSMSMTSVVIGE